MNVNRQEAQKLLDDKTWKGHLILGSIALLLAGVVSSPVFTLVRGLLELILGLGGLFYIGWALYQWYLLQEKH